MSNPSRPRRLPLSLALQGGGAHGAFTWGVLDRLLDEPDFEIHRITGTSAGALNGAALATGLARGGRAAAQELLEALWDKVAEAGSAMNFLLMPLRKPSMGIWDDAIPLLSPYQTNPLGMAPLRQVLDQLIDCRLINDARGPQLFVNAVNVHSGVSRVFRPDEISVETLLASACAPLSFQAIDIAGESYWDGSYACNPPLWPLYEGQRRCDILMIELAPLCRPETPTTAKNILNRISEIASINGLIEELRVLNQFNREVENADVRLHVLSMPETASDTQLEPSIKRTVSRASFESLRQTGIAAGERWLASHAAQVGQRASVDLDARYLARRERR